MREFTVAPPDDAPEHVKAEWFVLRRLGNGLRGLYGVPVHLCGSALRPDNSEPRDWDVRITIPDEDFAARFGGTAQEWAAQGETGEWGSVRWKWSDECVKLTKRHWKTTALNVDIQIYPESYVQKKYADLPRLRIDTR